MIKLNNNRRLNVNNNNLKKYQGAPPKGGAPFLYKDL